MRFVRRLLLIIILLSIVVIGGLLYQDVGALWSHNKNVIGLAVAVVVIALVLWYARSNVELQPDPFFLNLTFFAFAAQCIRTMEAWQTGHLGAWLIFFFLMAVMLLALELAVMRKHEKLTVLHYEKQLEMANQEAIAKARQEGAEKKAAPLGELNRWAKLLVKISGTDFLPGSLRLLAIVSMFEGEPKEKSKKEAVSILPDGDYIQTSDYLSPKGLTVSDPDQRLYGFLYIFFAALSWLAFVGALFTSR